MHWNQATLNLLNGCLECLLAMSFSGQFDIQEQKTLCNPIFCLKVLTFGQDYSFGALVSDTPKHFSLHLGILWSKDRRRAQHNANCSYVAPLLQFAISLGSIEIPTEDFRDVSLR